MRPSRGGSTPIRFFEELYAIVVGLGLALAVEQVIDLGREGFPAKASALPLFLAYLNFAMPLAHSSVRYLDLAYVDREIGPLTKGRVLGDLALGTGHFLWLIALSLLVSRPLAFAYVTIALLAGRLGREGLLLLAGKKVLGFDVKVARVHAATIVVVLLTLGVATVAQGETELWILRLGLLTASLGFALGLYLTAFGYFFPTEDEPAQEEPGHRVDLTD